MHKIKEKLMDELYEVEDKMKKSNGGKVSAGDLEYIHKLTDTIKNIDKIEMLEGDEGYSEDGHYLGEGRIYGTSYARGRTRAKRDGMGRYSRDDGMPYEHGSSYARNGRMGTRDGYSRDDAKEQMIEKLEDMMQDAHSSKEREALKRCIMQIENA